MKKKLGCLIIFTLLSCCCWVNPLHADTVIRVGYPLFPGFSEISEDGNYRGYTYEYLLEIAKYTGWTYEFVPVPSSDASLMAVLDQLSAGTIDLMGGMVRNDATAQLYDFPEFTSGLTYATLAVLADNSTYNSMDYQTFNGMTVGVARTATGRIKNLEKFCQANHIDVTLAYYHVNDLSAALINHEVDAILSGDLIPSPQERIVAKFAMQPYYFATTKGNAEVLNGLNAAIAKIHEVNPNYELNLYAKYFPQNDKHMVALSTQEKAYIAQAKSLTVALVKDSAPISSYDAQTGACKGIAVDMLAHVTEKTGLQFRFVEAANFEEALKMAAHDQVDMIASMTTDHQLAEKYHMTLTESYLPMQMIMVKNNRQPLTEVTDKILALPYGESAVNDTHANQIKRYNSSAECVKAVNDGVADYSYLDAYTAVQCTQHASYQNITLIPLPDSEKNLCLGLSKPSPVELVTIINKVMLSISDQDRQSLIFLNTLPAPQEVTISSYINANPTKSFFVLALLALVIIAAILFILHTQMKRKQQISLDRERYRILSDISDEFLFEYDFAQDYLSLSEKCATTFGCAPILQPFSKSIQEQQWENADLFWQILREKSPHENAGFDYCYHFNDAHWEWFHVTYTTICDQYGTAIRIIGKLVSIQKDFDEKEVLLEKSQIDALSGVYNRSAAEELITAYQRFKAIGISSALFFIDLDYFKGVNDDMGHQAGDLVLQDLAQTLKTLFSPQDIIGRLGGDEFIVLIKNVPDDLLLLKKAELLRQSMNKPFTYDDQQRLLSVSIGIALSHGNETFTQLYAQADKALYRQKDHGRNGFALYQDVTPDTPVKETLS